MTTGPTGTSAGLVEAVVALPFALPLHVNLLGKVTRAKIGSVNAQVHLPHFTTLSNGEMVVKGPKVTSVRSDIDWTAILQKSSPWGSVVSWRRTEGGQPTDVIADLHHVLLRTQVPHGNNETYKEQAQAIGDEIAQNVWAWLSLVADWFEVSTGSYLRRTSHEGIETLAVGPELHLWCFDGHKGHTLGRALTIPGGTVGRITANATSWRRILTKANTGLAPPVEHLLLRDSRGSLRQGDTRRAVLDAATATEMSLALLLDQYLGTAPEPIRAIVHAANRDMGRLTGTLRKNFNVALPPDVQSGLTERRNEVIHGGQKPSCEAAKQALDIATHIVDLAIPRSALLTAQ